MINGLGISPVCHYYPTPGHRTMFNYHIVFTMDAKLQLPNTANFCLPTNKYSNLLRCF
jgi:hypothetical protein